MHPDLQAAIVGFKVFSFNTRFWKTDKPFKCRLEALLVLLGLCFTKFRFGVFCNLGEVRLRFLGEP